MERRLWFLFFVSLFTICMASTSQNPFECRHPPKRKELEIFGVRSIYFSIPWNEPTRIVRRSGWSQTKFPKRPKFLEKSYVTIFKYFVFLNPRKKIPQIIKMIRPGFDCIYFYTLHDSNNFFGIKFESNHYDVVRSHSRFSTRYVLWPSLHCILNKNSKLRYVLIFYVKIIVLVH